MRNFRVLWVFFLKKYDPRAPRWPMTSRGLPFITEWEKTRLMCLFLSRMRMAFAKFRNDCNIAVRDPLITARRLGFERHNDLLPLITISAKFHTVVVGIVLNFR